MENARMKNCRFFTVAVLIVAAIVFAGILYRHPKRLYGVTHTFAALDVNNIFTGANTLPSINRFVYVDGITNTTLASAIASCPSNGCIIYDAIPETFASDPIAGTTKSFIVYFGAGTWNDNAQITLSASSQRWIGVGRNSGPNPCNSTDTGTCFVAGGSFPSSTAMFRIGNAATTGNVFETRLESMTIDCANVSGAIGVFTDAANEKSGTIDTMEIDCPVAGIQITSNAGAVSSNSVWRNTEVLPTPSTASAVGIKVGPSVVTGVTFENTTIVCQGTACTNAFTLDDAQAITSTHTHIENATNGIHVGATTASVGLLFFNTTGNSNVTNLFKIESGTTNAIQINVWHTLGGTNAIVDSLTACTITDGTGSFYSIAANQTRFTTSTNCVSTIGGGLSVLGGFSVGSGGSGINKILLGSGIALNSAFTSITAPGCQDQTLTLTGAATTGVAKVAPSSSIGTNFSWNAYVSSANTVDVHVCAFVTGTPTSVTWNAEVVQ